MKEENTMTTEERAAAEAQPLAQEQTFIEAQPAADEKAVAASAQTETQPAEAAEQKPKRRLMPRCPKNSVPSMPSSRHMKRSKQNSPAAASGFGRSNRRTKPPCAGEPSPVPTACAQEQTPFCEAVMNVPSGQEGAEKPFPALKEEGEAFVPLMTHAGAGVMAPAVRPNSFEEAGRLALGYLKKTR